MDLTPDQVRAFVGPKADYYLERWPPIHDEWGSRALGFNWAACFLNLSWLLYRRMYRCFWIAGAVWIGSLLLLMLASVAALLIKANGLILLLAIGLMVMPIVFAVTFGVFGNYWYYLHARRQVSRLTTDGPADLEAVGRIGGTNLRGAMVFSVVCAILGIWGEFLSK